MHRINWPWRILTLIIIGPATAVTVGGLMGLTNPATLVPAATPDRPCFRVELGRALADIDPQRRMPLAISEIDGGWGRTDIDTGVVRIDPDVPCGQVRGVVAHEWAHYRQHEIYGSYEAAVEALPSIETNADCVAETLAPDARRAYLGDRECTPDDAAAAALTMKGLPA